MPIGAMRSSNYGLHNADWINGGWITSRRLSAQGIILALCLWSVYGWIVATPGLRDRNGNLKGTDFSHLYTLGSVALTHRTADLYDVNGQAKLTALRIPGAAGIAYIPMYPPQVSIFFAARTWRGIAGGIVSATAQLALPAIYYGPESLRAWLRVMRSVAYNVAVLEPRPYQTHNLRIFWTMLIPGRTLPFALYVISALVILGFAAAVWTRRPALPLGGRYSSLLLASVLVAPHLIVYDLVILAPVFLLMADWVLAQSAIAPAAGSASAMKVILYLTYLATLLSGPIARWTHLQVSVVVMSGLIYVVWRAGGATKRCGLIVSR